MIEEFILLEKPIQPISTRCDNEAMFFKAYGVVYNGDSRHVRLRDTQIK